jgi:predicted acylesterase/phospholipase RssA/CRP-like cAMP-binding protein
MSPSYPDRIKILDQTALFAGLPVAMLTAIAEDCLPVRTSEGAVLIAPGAEADSLYLIVSGRFKVFRESNLQRSVGEVANLSTGDVAGDFGLLTGEKRGASVVACSDGQLLRLSRVSFDRLKREWPNEMRTVTSRIEGRVRASVLQEAIRHSTFLGSLELSVQRELCAAMQLKSCHAGDVLFSSRDPSDSLYILLTGRLHVFKEDGQPRNLIGEIRPGETVGEIGVLSGEPRSATVEAARDSLVGRLSRDAYRELLTKYPIAIESVFSRRLVQVLRQSRGGDEKTKMALSVAVLPIGSLEVVAPFARMLADALSAIGPTLHLNSTRTRDYLSERSSIRICDEDTDETSLMLWLNSKEAEYQFIVYEADPDPTSWSRRCIRQSDRILLACDSAGARVASKFEAELSLVPASVERILVLIRDSVEPSGTERWLATHQVGRHFHVRSGSHSEFARVARLLTGKSNLLVLGGGFARGIAHLGVIQAMHDLSIPIDAIGGTSMGGIVAALYAMGYSHDESLRIVIQGNSLITRDLTLPVLGLVTGTRMRHITSGLCGDRSIEDLTIPFFCVSANLSRGRAEVHTRGSLVKAVLATSRVPGIFPPLVSNGDLLVDGGIVNSVPVDVMKELFPGSRVIAVDVSPTVECTDNEDLGFAVSGWRVFAQKWFLRAPKKRVPSIFTVLMRTVDFTSEGYRKRVSAAADLYLRPPLAQLRFNDFRRGSRAAEMGRKYAHDVLREWLLSTESLKSRPD